MPRHAIGHLALTLAAVMITAPTARGEVSLTGTATSIFFDDQNCTDCAPFIDSPSRNYDVPAAFFTADLGEDRPKQGRICVEFALGEPWIHVAEDNLNPSALPMATCLTALHMGTEVEDPP